MNLSFAIVTDSGADFTPEFQKKYDIHLVKTRIMINEVEFIDRENITREEIIKQMIEDKVKTSTSLAPRYEFAETFEKLLEKYEKILFIGISSKMSATYQSAYLMAKKVDREKIVVMDTKSVSWGMSFLIYHAALRREQGIPLEKVVEELTEKRTIN